MKILHVITSLRTGGTEKLMTDLLPRLNYHGIDADLFLFDGTETAFKRDLREKDINIYESDIRNKVYHPGIIRQLLPFQSRYDIIHTHNTAPQFFAAINSCFCRTPLITTEHSTSNHRRHKKLFRNIDKWMYSRYKSIICISPMVESNLRNYLASNNPNIKTIYNGIDTEKFASAHHYDKILDSDEDNYIKIIQVAAFRYQKDQATVINALSLLPEHFHLYFAGDGENRSACENLATRKGVADRVHFLGIREDIPSLIASSDIVVMSSLIEGFGLAAVEGMAAGKPVIASDVPGLREVVEGAGILFPVKDHTALADKILKLSSDKNLYNRTSLTCASRALQYDISRMTEEYIREYESILHNV